MAALAAPLRNEDDVPGILIGADLARDLDLHVGDSVTVLTPEGTLSPMGMMPRTRRLRVAGIFRLGLYEFDSTYGFVSMAMATRLFGKDDVDLIQLRVDEFRRAGHRPRDRRALRQRLLGAGLV